jgi:hypothetical protein
MSDLGTAVSLLVATAELGQVRAIRNAVRANLIAAGGVEGALGTITMPKGVGLTREQPREVEYAPRRVIEPMPAYEPRQTVRPDPIVEPASVVPSVDAGVESRLDHPLVPPWRMPLPEDEDALRPIIKCPPPPAEFVHKGLLIDLIA